MEKLYKNKYIKIILILIVLMNTIFLQISFADDELEEPDYNLTYEEELAVSNSVGEVSIQSRSAVILDRTSGEVMWGKQENNKVAQASTTKIMTAIILLENEPNLGKTVEVDKKAAAIGGSRLGLSTGNKITMHDLLYGLMLCSRK